MQAVRYIRPEPHPTVSRLAELIGEAVCSL
jgi:hypothetical protein